MNITDAQLAPYLDALASDDPEGRLIRLVLEFKKAGGTQQQASDLISALGDKLGAWKARDARASVLEDVGDMIEGNCSLSNHIFRHDFEESHLWRKIPPAV